MAYASLDLFVLLVYHLMFMTLTIEIKSWLHNFSSMAIGIINFVIRSQCFIVGIRKYNFSLRTTLREDISEQEIKMSLIS